MDKCEICGEPIVGDDWHDNVTWKEDEIVPDERWPDDAKFHGECCPLCAEQKAGG